MKKILIFLILSLLATNNLFAKTKKYENSFYSFNNWLFENGHNKYYEKDANGFPKHNLNIKTHPNKWGIHYPSNPNRDSLIYYFYKYQFIHLTGDSGTYQWKQVEVKPSTKPYQFQSNLIEDKFGFDFYMSKPLQWSALEAIGNKIIDEKLELMYPDESGHKVVITAAVKKAPAASVIHEKGRKPSISSVPPIKVEAVTEENWCGVGSKKSCLLAENNALVNKVLTSVLKLNGFEVILAKDSQALVNRMKERQYDVVIVTENLPEDGGLQAIMEYRDWEIGACRSTKQSIIYNAAVGCPMDSAMASMVGIDHFMNSFDMEALKKLIKEIR